jgi:TPR repeat protein
MAVLAAKGADIMESGVCDPGPWGAKLLGNFGEGIADKVRGHLLEVYAASQDELSKRQNGVRSSGQAYSDGTTSAPQSSGEPELALPVAVNGGPAGSPGCYGRGTGDPRTSGTPTPGPRRLRWAFGLTAASAAVLCLAAAWAWQHREPMQVAAKNSVADTIAVTAADRPPLPDSGKLKDNVPDEVEALKARAQTGDADAQYDLGVRYSKADGVPLDQANAVAWYRRAAEQGSAKAQAALGYCYSLGKGVAKDDDQSIVWSRKAAEQGNARGQNNVGADYATGHGVGQDYKEAVKWFRKAAEQGYTNAQCNLGGCYALGHGVVQDYAEAVKCFRKAAEQGDARGQYNLGLSYAKGQGVSQDYAEAVKWFRKVAEQGESRGQNGLGVHYENGWGVVQDYGEAVKWYRKAAEQGNPTAQFHLAWGYYSGRGVSQDYCEAYKWCNLVQSQAKPVDLVKCQAFFEAPGKVPVVILNGKSIEPSRRVWRCCPNLNCWSGICHAVGVRYWKWPAPSCFSSISNTRPRTPCCCCWKMGRMAAGARTDYARRGVGKSRKQKAEMLKGED